MKMLLMTRVLITMILMTVILMTMILMKMVGLPQGQFSTDTWDKITHTQERTRGGSFNKRKKIDELSNYSPIYYFECVQN